MAKNRIHRDSQALLTSTYGRYPTLYNKLGFQLIISEGHTTREVSLCEVQPSWLGLCRVFFQTKPNLGRNITLCVFTVQK
jgi:hypothetical protein